MKPINLLTKVSTKDPVNKRPINAFPQNNNHPNPCCFCCWLDYLFDMQMWFMAMSNWPLNKKRFLNNVSVLVGDYATRATNKWHVAKLISILFSFDFRFLLFLLSYYVIVVCVQAVLRHACTVLISDRIHIWYASWLHPSCWGGGGRGEVQKK